MNQIEQERLLLERLKENEQEAYLSLYHLYYPDLARYVLNNSGNREDAEDVFQETLLVLLHKIRGEHFQLTSELKTFLYAINRIQWLKKLRSRQISIPLESLEHSDNIPTDDVDFDLQQHQQSENWLQRLFENITGHCVVLITRIFLKQHEPEALIKELGYKNSHTFQNQKYKCINQLRKAGKKFPLGG
ncbi:RNA polymerase sigma factor [Cytophaga aurantiaca]|uniref:RNA polymerase sigma factor n=1 Tax=Cytophaga aurantiaca TaxID=29530 RepID=UPI00035FFC30|nr:RNA polymerase sigma factor [Cytophaga aurantiaca]